MQVIVDDRAYAGALSDNRTVQEIADEICRPAAARDGRLVIGLACNGQAVAAEDLERVLQSPVGAFETVELQTVSVQEQVEGTLAQAYDTLSQTHPLREQAADLLSQGRHEAAMGELQKILEILKQVQQTSVLAAQLLAVDLEALNPGGRSFLETLSLVREQLTELKSGMEAQDFVQVADLLRYEFAEPLDAWASILRSLQEIAEG